MYAANAAVRAVAIRLRRRVRPISVTFVVLWCIFTPLYVKYSDIYHACGVIFYFFSVVCSVHWTYGVLGVRRCQCSLGGVNGGSMTHLGKCLAESAGGEITNYGNKWMADRSVQR